MNWINWLIHFIHLINNSGSSLIWKEEHHCLFLPRDKRDNFVPTVALINSAFRLLTDNRKITRWLPPPTNCCISFTLWITSKSRPFGSLHLKWRRSLQFDRQMTLLCQIIARFYCAVRISAARWWCTASLHLKWRRSLQFDRQMTLLCDITLRFGRQIGVATESINSASFNSLNSGGGAVEIVLNSCWTAWIRDS